MKWYEVVGFILIELVIVAIAAYVSSVLSKCILKEIAVFMGILTWWSLSVPLISYFYDKE